MGLPAQAPAWLLPLIDVAQSTFRFGTYTGWKLHQFQLGWLGHLIPRQLHLQNTASLTLMNVDNPDQ